LQLNFTDFIGCKNHVCAFYEAPVEIMQIYTTSRPSSRQQVKTSSHPMEKDENESVSGGANFEVHLNELKF
jgi:hypothetical protein